MTLPTPYENGKLYEDDFLCLYEDRISIKWFYFPMGSKTVHFRDIEWVKTDEEMDIGILGAKVWGMGLSPIWWAVDWSRGMLTSSGERSTQLIIKVKGDGIRKGFGAWKDARIVGWIKELVTRPLQ